MIKRSFSGANVYPPGGVIHKVSASSSWHMPDGTKTTNRPKDGSVLHTFDSQGNATTWQWDDFLESWHNVSSGKPTKYNTATFPAFKKEELKEWVHIDLSTNSWEKKCECGSEKVGSPKHSSWCAKFDPRT